MSELDLSNIANTSISTPASGVTALFADLDGNLKIKNSAGVVTVIEDYSFGTFATAGGTTTFTNVSPTIVQFTGASNQTLVLPDATTMQVGWMYYIDNDSTGTITVNANGGGLITSLPPDICAIVILYANSPAAGTWDSSFYVPIKNVNGTSTLIAGTTTFAPLNIPAGVLLTSAAAGMMEADAAAFYLTLDTTNGRAFSDRWNLFRLAANGVASNPIADFFGSTDGIPLVGTAVYEIEWHCYFAVAALAGTVTWTITNTGTLTNMVASYEAVSAAAGLGAIGAMRGAGVVTSTTAAQALPVSDSLTITTNHYHIVRALIEQNGTGNVRLRFTGGVTTTIQPLRGSYAKIRRLPAGNAGAFVA